MADIRQFPTVEKLFVMDDDNGSRHPHAAGPQFLFRINPDGSSSIATIADVHNAIIQATKQPQEVVDRHKNKITSILANVPANKQPQFAQILIGAGLNFLTDEEFDECANVARMFVAADDAMVGN